MYTVPYCTNRCHRNILYGLVNIYSLRRCTYVSYIFYSLLAWTSYQMGSLDHPQRMEAKTSTLWQVTSKRNPWTRCWAWLFTKLQSCEALLYSKRLASAVLGRVEEPRSPKVATLWRSALWQAAGGLDAPQDCNGMERCSMKNVWRTRPLVAGRGLELYKVAMLFSISSWEAAGGAASIFVEAVDPPGGCGPMMF